MLKVNKSAKQKFYDPEGKDVIKILFLGSAKAGKTAILERFVSGEFSPEYRQTMGSELLVKQVTIHDSQKAVLHVWSCGGHPRYRPLLTNYYYNAKAAVIVFDMTDINSFKDVLFWYNEVQRMCPEAIVTLVGTKSDKEDLVRVTPEECAKQAKAWSVKHVIVSSSSGDGVAVLFKEVLHSLHAAITEA
eukprot:Opistho-2@77397